MKLKFPVILIIMCALLCTCSMNRDYQIIIPSEPSVSEMLASREVRRYVYLRTDLLLPIVQTDAPASKGNCIVIAQKDEELLGNYSDLAPSAYENLGPQEFILKSVPQGKNMVHLIIGGDPEGILYGAYRFAEKMGVRFYLHGDVIPDARQKPDFPVMDETGKPLFQLRGILPFHDFPEGPDWWSLEEYKAIIGQLPRLKMNFIGFHTYPEITIYPSGYCQAEPLVWIGPEKDINDDGTVRSAYPVLHFNTGDDTWGYQPMITSDFHCGAAQLFERDYFGADYLVNTSQFPRPEEENVRIFNQVGSLLEDAFSFAHDINVKTCIGTEIPLTVPSNVRNRLMHDGLKPGIQQVRELYKGMFQRIIKTHPLDYYWLWTNESWTWSGITAKDIQDAEIDQMAAISAVAETGFPFTLATCGWVLGPPDDPTRFDASLPKNMPFSCINREVGFSLVEPYFAKVTGRPKWAIPWMEDDPALISPQLWAGRMRKDAADALKYGCDGLMGIHWRTRILGPNVSALAEAAWNYSGSASAAPDMETEERDLPVSDFYEDWAQTQFGLEASDRIAEIFNSLDGGPAYNKENHARRPSSLFRIADWQAGPGGILVHQQPWLNMQQEFRFIENLENIRPEIVGKGNLERFDYWLNTFRYARSVVHFGCVMGEIDSVLKILSENGDGSSYREGIEKQVLPLRIQAAMTWVEMMNYMLQTVSTTGELGTISNLEQHNLGTLKILNKHDSLIIAVTGKPLPPEAELSEKYFGPLRIIVPALRNLLEPGEDLNMRVILLSAEPVRDVFFYWRNLGKIQFNKVSLAHVSRGVYKLALPADEMNNEDLEYYIEAVSASEATAFFPATAPEMNQTIVIAPASKKLSAR